MRQAHGRQCRSLALEISEYLDGDMPASRMKTLERHLSECVCCADFAESLRRSVEACRTSGICRIPADVRARARRRVAELLAREPLPRRRPASLSPSPAARAPRKRR
jgi:anti-sigma factor RsiW